MLSEMGLLAVSVVGIDPDGAKAGDEGAGTMSGCTRMFGL
jgi:hypothetical protein